MESESSSSDYESEPITLPAIPQTITIVVPQHKPTPEESQSLNAPRLVQQQVGTPAKTGETPTNGKRQRKANSLYNGYAIDKKTTELMNHNSPATTTTTAEGTDPNGQVGKREVIMSPDEAKKRMKNLPKGYVYEAIVEPQAQVAVTPSPNKSNKKRKKKEEEVDVDDSGPASSVKQGRTRRKARPSNVKDEDEYNEDEDDDDFETAAAKPKKSKSSKHKKEKHSSSSMQHQLDAVGSKLEQLTQNLAVATQAEVVTIKPVTPASSKKQSSSRPPSKRSSKKKDTEVFEKLDSDYEEDEYESDKPKKEKKEKKEKKRASHSPSVAKPKSSHRKKKGEKISEYLEECHKIVQHLLKSKHAWPFKEPVDPVALGILDYHDVIKHPMDLGTVASNIKEGVYDTIDQVADDVRLIWRNAVAYNGESHPVAQLGVTLSEMFEKKFAKLKNTVAKATPAQAAPVQAQTYATSPVADSPVIASIIKEHMASTLNEVRELRAELQALKKEKAALRKQVSTPPPPPAPKQKGPGRPKTRNTSKPAPKPAAAKEDTRPMTFEEKRVLSDSINSLPTESLVKIVQIIHTRMPSLAQTGDEIELDIDALDNGTLRALERYVKQVLSKSAPVKEPEPVVSAAKSIAEVKQKLQEQSKSRTDQKKKEDEEVVIDDVEETQNYPSILIPRDDSSSSSSSSSDSSDSSSSDSDSSSAEKKKKSATSTTSTTTTSTTAVPMETEVAPKLEEKETPLQILNPTPSVAAEVELKNVDAWTKLDAWDSPTSQTKDETWSQFQTRDLQNQQREKEREERERKEKQERELERKKLEEQRLKELAEAEEKKRQQDEEENKRAQLELEARREAARRAREEVASQKPLMEQNSLMNSFEMNMNMMRSDEATSSILDALRLKQDSSFSEFQQQQQQESIVKDT